MIDHVIKREELLADAEGHAAVLRDEINNWRGAGDLSEHDTTYLIPAMEAGALALTERPAAQARARKLASVLERCPHAAGCPMTWYEVMREGRECECGRDAALKESHYE